MQILKLGSKGEDVKLLQRFLKIEMDGDFGAKTELSVKAWQAKNSLTADGVVGYKTQNAMGLLDTDKHIAPTDTKNDFIEKAYLPKDQYFAGPTKKEWLFLHHTAGWHNPFTTITGWAKDTRGSIATEFVLGGQSVLGNDYNYDGIVAQAFPEGGYGWHLGTGNNAMHKNSVGIEVCSFGQIDNGKTYVGTVASQTQIVKLKQSFRGHQYWHKYSDKQIQSLKQLIEYIAVRDNIDVKKGLVPLIHSKGAFAAFDFCDVPYCVSNKGLWMHTNVLRGKVDMFPQDELVDMLISL